MCRRAVALLALIACGTSAPDREPAERLRRAEQLDREGKPAEALRELDGLDTPLRAKLELSAHVRAGRAADAARMIAGAPLPDRPALAYRAAADAPAAQLGALGTAATEPELAAAVADRIERDRGPVAALEARERAATMGPARAEHHDALARALVASSRTDEALAAWDRAAAIAPAQPAYRLAPIRALVALGDRARARARVAALAAEVTRGEVARTDSRTAHGAEDRGSIAAGVELALMASAAAAAIGDTAQALELARTAQRRRPGDGRLAFAVAERLAAAGDRPAAAAAFGELLACGAHGRAWHRHEVAAKLVALAGDAASQQLVRSALDAKRACTVEAADLATYVEAARQKLSAR